MSEPVSIIIPVHNRTELTRRCLRAIGEFTVPGTYEVIIIDNGSDEPMFGPGETLGAEIRWLRNDRNLGFGEAANQGAAAARHPLLLFLNNDVIVGANWLPPLTSTVIHHDRVGAVGAKLLFEDGRLQEAGGIVWSDGSSKGYGRGEDPGCPSYNYVREVDYCSAACLLVPRAVFETVGGFAPQYSPAYYEDTHLCFEMRKRGYRVLYQPASEVVHLGGATAGDLKSSYGAYLALNREVFRHAQRRALRAQFPRADHHLLGARERGDGSRILVIDDRVPRFDRDSGSLRRFSILRMLKEEGHRVTFLPDDLVKRSPYGEGLQQMGIEVLYGSLSIPDYLRERAGEFDTIIVARAPVAQKYLPGLRADFPTAHIIFDTVDLHYLREFRAARLRGEAEAEKKSYTLKQAELYLSRLSSAVWVVSPAERELLLAEEPNLSVAIVPNIHVVRKTIPDYEARRDVMFIGGFEHPPNIDAVLFFAEAVLPRLVREVPDIRFFIVGSSPPPSVCRLESDRVRVTGYVPDVEPYFDRCRVAVAPLRYGAGIKGKVGQSLANGVPTVLTYLAAEGMGLTDGENALLADEPEEFAAAVLRLYGDPVLWEKCSVGGRALVDRCFSPARVRSQLRGSVDF